LSYLNIMDVEGVSGIIRYLSINGESKNIHLKSVIPNHYRLHQTMIKMKDAGLVDYVFEVSPKKIYRYWLTEKGKLVAVKLAEIDKIINS